MKDAVSGTGLGHECHLCLCQCLCQFLHVNLCSQICVYTQFYICVLTCVCVCLLGIHAQVQCTTDWTWDMELWQHCLPDCQIWDHCFLKYHKYLKHVICRVFKISLPFVHKDNIHNIKIY